MNVGFSEVSVFRGPHPTAHMDELFIGTLSGTSMDGLDAALVRFAAQPELLVTRTLPLPEDLRQELLALAQPGADEIERLGRADVRLGELFARLVHELLSAAGRRPDEVTAIGSHGQTIRHRPAATPPFTLQIGDPNVLAARTGLPVVADFRRMDVALGGQGAPLVPAFHDACFRLPGTDRVVLNLGGIANVTVLRGDGAPVLGFDTGPGNTLLDAWSRRVLREPMDRDGRLADQGRVQPELLAALLDDPFFRRPAPKSTGPEHFSPAWLDGALSGLTRVADADVQATLAALTARTVADAIRALPGLQSPEVLVCGGGARNPVLRRMLQAELPGCRIRPSDDAGIPAAWVEAMAFAWLARERWHQRPGSRPAVTGASRPALLGGVWLP
jgi:anhydro-N-acetylmuramic acid kinase